LVREDADTVTVAVSRTDAPPQHNGIMVIPKTAIKKRRWVKHGLRL